jgi:hypothetical protein
MPHPRASKVNMPQLSRAVVFAGPDQPLLLEQLWRKQSVILVFLRHFACIACRAHAAQVWQDRQKYEASGAKIIFIGNGQPAWIEVFRHEVGVQDALVLTDPSMASFDAAGFKRRLLYLFRPKSSANMKALAAEGFEQGQHRPDAGSHFQMGGILAVSRSGEVLYQFASTAVGDFPSEPYLEIIRRDEQAA